MPQSQLPPQSSSPVLPAEVAAYMDRRGWIPGLKPLAATLIARYGMPNEVTPSRMVWNHSYVNSPWKRSELLNEQVPHQFPIPHTESLQQYIDYRVPAHMASQLTLFDGSVYLDRTRGELSARSADEASNFLALNLAWLICTGQLDWQAARGACADAVLKGQHAYLRNGLVFAPVQGYQGDPDHPWLSSVQLQQRIQAPLPPPPQAISQAQPVQGQPAAQPVQKQTDGPPVVIPAIRPGGLPSVFHGFVPAYRPPAR